MYLQQAITKFTNYTFYFIFSVCQSKDIRNKPDHLSLLKGCRVIEGFLIISLMDEQNDTNFTKYEFPELVEIVDFFLLYRVNGLPSLSKLFPNLRVIRGNALVWDYSFIVFEMQHLQVNSRNVYSLLFRICFQANDVFDFSSFTLSPQIQS